MIDQRSVGTVLDRVEEVCVVCGAVIGWVAEPTARFLDVGQIGVPHFLERNPFGCIGEARCVARVIGVHVLPCADAVVGDVDALACGAAVLEGDGVVDLGVGWGVFEALS